MLFCHKRCRNMLFPNRISHQISPQHRISHQSLPWHRPPVQHHSTQLGSFCQEEQQQSVKHGCRVWRCNPPAPIPLPTGRAAGQHLYGNGLQHLSNVSAVYPTFALLIKLLIKAINSPNTKRQQVKIITHQRLFGGVW